MQQNLSPAEVSRAGTAEYQQWLHFRNPAASERDVTGNCRMGSRNILADASLLMKWSEVGRDDGKSSESVQCAITGPCLHMRLRPSA